METLTPQQLAEEGQTDYKAGQYRSAASLFNAAADGFSSAGDELSAAEMKNNSSVAFLKAGDAVSALDATTGTAEVFAMAGDRKRQAMAIGNGAAALEKLHRPDEAIANYEETARLLGELGEWELRAHVMQSLSSMQMKRGRFLEAYATLRAGVLGIEKPNLRQRILKSLVNIPYRHMK
jgi:tetratricopeptide (TPR) repeat protein